MLISYLRSSSYNNWDFCAAQYFMTYVLGITKPAPKSADKGTVVHKVMECLALLNQSYKKFGKYEIVDDNIGTLSFSEADWNKGTKLSVLDVANINSSRSNPYTYKSKCNVEYGMVRTGVDVIEHIFNLSYNYYSSRSPVKWNNTDRTDCLNWTWIPLEYKGGILDPRKLNILEAEQHFDFHLGPFGIKGTIDLLTQPSDDSIEIVDWKGLPLDTKIPTINGWSTMGELEEGDIIFDKDGNQTTIIGKSQVKYKDCYRLTFDDNTQVTCDDEHLWLLNDLSTVKVTNLKYNDKIDVTKPVSYNYKELPIDPYVLGVWLGDGRSRNGEISNNDSFIFDEIRRRGYRVGKNIASSSTKTPCEQRTVFGLRGKLRKLGLLNNKNIPSIYLEASISQRLDLLRGLMDSDGNVNSCRKQAVFTSCNKTLSDNVKSILLSLGQRPNQAFIKRFIYNKDVFVYPISFRPLNINPFLLPRKSNKIGDWGVGQSSYRVIKRIEKLPTKKYTQCIMVDSPSHTYLCTENYIPTHNTGQRKNWATGQRKDFKALSKDFQLMLYAYATRKLYPNIPNVSVTIFFIRDGGPFTVHFDDEKIEEVYNLLLKRYEEISACELPPMCDPTQQDVKCQKFCEFYQMKGDNGDNFCKFIHEEIKTHGIEYVTEKHKNKTHSTTKYKAPGE